MLLLGGNDMNRTSKPAIVFSDIMYIVIFFEEAGDKNVLGGHHGKAEISWFDRVEKKQFDVNRLLLINLFEA